MNKWLSSRARSSCASIRFFGSVLLLLAGIVALSPHAHSGDDSNYAFPLQDTLDIGLHHSADGVLIPSPTTTNNGSVTLSNGSMPNPNYVIGGLNVQRLAADALTSGNSVTINGGRVEDSGPTFTGSAFGGLAFTETSNATASNNSISMTAGTLDWNLTASWARSWTGNAMATGSNASLSGGTVTWDFTGGMAETTQGSGNAEATHNVLAMSGGSVLGNDGVTAGWAISNGGSATVLYNTMIMTNGQVDYSGAGAGWAQIQGGSGWSVASNNYSLMSGGTLNNSGNMYGGYAEVTDLGSGKVEDNIASLAGGTLDGGNLMGGGVILDGGIGGGSATANRNSASMSGGVIMNNGGVYGGWARSTNGRGDAYANDNSVVMSGGAISGGGGVYGGWARVSSTGAANDNASVRGNSVLMMGGSINNDGVLCGGYIRGYNGTLTASANAIALQGGTVNGNVCGGWILESPGSNGTATASANTVTIQGGGVNGNIYGGWIQAGGNGTYAATNNTVTVSGSPVFGANTVLYGGLITGGATGDVFTGNTLNLHTTGLAAKNVANFQNYNFYVPAGIAAGTTMMTLTDTNKTDLTAPGTNVTVSLLGKPALSAGQSINLLQNENTVVANPIPSFTARFGLVDYTFDISSGGTALKMTLEGTGVSEESKSPAEGIAASAAFLGRGADLAAGKGMASAQQAVNSPGARTGWVGFNAMSGGGARHPTGSHVDVRGLSFVSGFVKRLPVNSAEVMAGAFFESGFGSYDTSNPMADGSSVEGWGHSNYLGGGLLGRAELTTGAASGLYAESTFRAGGLSSNYKSDDINPALGRAVYDINAAYVGAHAGVGHIWRLSERSDIDLYGKYFWTHTTGNTVRIFDDPVTFKAVDSHRMRTGGRFNFAIGEKIRPYAGAAYEYEFDGDARSIVAGHGVPAPSLQGSTGIAELGMGWQPSATRPLTIDMNVEGTLGARRGVAGSLWILYAF